MFSRWNAIRHAVNLCNDQSVSIPITRLHSYLILDAHRAEPFDGWNAEQWRIETSQMIGGFASITAEQITTSTTMAMFTSERKTILLLALSTVVVVLFRFGIVELSSDDLRGQCHVAQGKQKFDLLFDLRVKGIVVHETGQVFQLRMGADVELKNVRPGEVVHGDEGEIDDTFDVGFRCVGHAVVIVLLDEQSKQTDVNLREEEIIDLD